MKANRESRVAWLLAVAALTLGTAVGCGSKGPKGDTGATGASPDGGGCTIADNGDGTSTVTCADGTTATIANGKDGASGTGCTAAEVDGGVLVTCGDASITVPNGKTGATGAPGEAGVSGNNGNNGLNAGQTPGLTATATVSDPSNGKFFAQGEKIVYTVKLTTADGTPVDLDYFKTAALYMNGPRGDVLKDKTRCELLGCSTDRTKDPHFYIDLKTNTSSNLVVNGNTVTYTMDAIPANEDPGTYTIGLRLIPQDPAYIYDQVFELTDVQIGTATVDPEIVGVDKSDGTGSCADCHLGAANKKEYMHHIDPGYDPKGSPSLDSVPVRTCLMCHNQEGYSAIQICNADAGPGATKASGGSCPDGGTPSYLPDPIVRRVHGVHMGENLLSNLATGPNADFGSYSGLAFPAGIKDCTKCHKDNDWKTKPSREACGACHDQVDWADAKGKFVPPRPIGVYCQTQKQCDDAVSGTMETAEAVECDTTDYSVAVCPDMTLPGRHGCSNDAGTVTAGMCVLTKHGGGQQLDDSKCANCHVGSGAIAGAIEDSHKIAPLAVAYTVDISMTDPTNGTDYENSETPKVTITLKDATTNAAINPLTDPPATGQLFVSGPRMDTGPVLTAPAAAAAAGNDSDHYVYVDLNGSGDTNLSVTATGYQYQLSSVQGLTKGTYTVFARFQKASEPRSYSLINFQVKTATVEQKVATNCTSCHADSRMHGYAKFDTDICKNCHDYQQQALNLVDWPNSGWTVGTRYGFGTTPLKRRIHGVHFGHYLSHPEQITGTASDFNDVIFPQDVRNCVKCHDTTKTGGTWATEPDRIACLACHDSDSDQAHAALMTQDPTPDKPYSGDETESCESCHGAGHQFSVSNVHNITNPYVMPYSRDPSP